MATRGNSNQIIVGAAQLFVSNSGPLQWSGSAYNLQARYAGEHGYSIC